MSQTATLRAESYRPCSGRNQESQSHPPSLFRGAFWRRSPTCRFPTREGWQPSRLCFGM